MHKIATLHQWKELYDIAIETKTLEPWKYLWDSDGITLILPVRDEYYQSMLKDLCKQTKIRLEAQSRLNAIDTLVDGLNNLNNW